MRTEIFNQSQIDEAALLLKRGEVVAFPTETVYGLGASIFFEEAVQRVFKAKGRPQDNPLIAHISSLEQIELLAKELPPFFFPLAEAFFPGPLTLVLPRHGGVPSSVSAGLPTIAVRMPALSLAQELINAADAPLVAPSANLSGRPSATTAQHVFDDLGGKIAGIVDGGPCLLGIESTVLDLVSFSQPTILRPGHISKEAIEKVIQAEVVEYVSGPKASPGMKYRHYAPKAPVKVFDSRSDLDVYLQTAPSIRRMVLSQESTTGPFDTFTLSVESFYSHLRIADAKAYEEVLIVCDEALKKHAGLMNRIEHLVMGIESHSK